VPGAPAGPPILLRHARLVDGPGPECDVLIEGSRIRAVSDVPLKAECAQVLGLRGQTLMPGLIDCHAHP